MRRCFLLAAIGITMSGCQVDPRETLSIQALRNGSYQNEMREDGLVQLSDGLYESREERFSASMPELIAYGDLDRDGVEDAVALLAINTGGSGVFEYLVAVGVRNRQPAQLATGFLGDRIRVASFVIEDGAVVVTLTAHGPDDPMCCPTQESTWRYRLEGNALVKQES